MKYFKVQYITLFVSPSDMVKHVTECEYKLTCLLLFKKARMSEELSLNINIKEPKWDQGTFMGRAKHFFMVTDPRNVLLSSETLEEARVITENYR